MSQIYFEATFDTSKLREGIKKANQTMGEWARDAQKNGLLVDNTIGTLQRRIMQLASIHFASQIGNQIIKVRGEFQQLGIAFETMLGSKARADKLMNEAVVFAQKTPFTLTDVASNIKQLMAMGIATEDVMDTMKALGDVAAGVSVPISRIAVNYGQVAALGRLQQREIRDFAMAGIPIVEELAKQFRKTSSEISDMVEAGQIGFPAVEKAFASMSGEGGKFYNLMEKQNKSVTGQISNLQDKIQVMLNSIGKANEGLIYGGISALSDLVTNYEEVLDILKTIIATYGTYKAATIVTTILREAEAAGTLAAALRKTAVAQLFLNTAQKASPVGLALAGITALVGGYAVWQKHIKQTGTFTSELNKSIADEILELDSLFKKIKSTSQGTEERANAIKLANDRYGEYLNNLLTEKSTLEDIETAQRNATNALIANISVQRSQNKLSEVLGDISSKFDKEFSGFIQKFGEVYGTDRIPEFVTAINDAIDEKIKAGGGQVERGMLEYSQIAKDVYDEFVKEISQKTGFLQYDFKSFKDSFLDFAEFKADKSGFVKQLEGMIAAYQGMVDKFKETGTGGSAGSRELEEVEDLGKQINQLYKDLQTADEKDRKVIAERIVALQKELLLRQEIADIAIKAVRNDTVPDNIKSIGQTVFEGDLKPIKKVEAEFDKLNKKIETSREKAEQMQNALDAERLKKTLALTEEIAFHVQGITDKYAEQLGLTEDQNKVLQNGLQSISGIADIASGNVIQGAAKLVDSMMGLFLKAPEKLSEHFENVQKQVDKILNSISIASESLSNLNVDSSLTGITILKSQLTGIADEAKKLNKELENTYYGHRRSSWSNVMTNIVKDVADLNKEIEALSERLLSGGISDDQRKAIEAVLQGYNSLVSEMNAMISDVIGISISDLKNSLADAFFEAEDAAKSWGDTVNDVIANIAKKQLVSKLLTTPVEEAVNTLINDYSDGSLSTLDIAKFQDAMTSLYSTVAPAFQEAIKGLEGMGIDFGSGGTSAGLTGALRREMTEESAGELAGIWRKTSDDTRQIRDYTKIGINHLAGIEANTYNTVLELKNTVNELRNSNSKLEQIVSNTKPVQTGRDLGL